MTDTISVLTGAPTQSAAQQDAVQLADDFDDFLLLLTEQLQNQDPLEPLDSTEFTSQLVEFASVEQLVQQNANLEQIVALYASNSAASAVSFLGQQGAISGDVAELSNGEAAWRYDLPQIAAQTAITIRDANGDVVHTAQGEVGEGVHVFAWDGRNSAGEALPDGLYTIEIEAIDDADQPITPTVAGYQTIEAVDFSLDDAGVVVNGRSVPLSSIAEVRAVAA